MPAQINGETQSSGDRQGARGEDFPQAAVNTGPGSTPPPQGPVVETQSAGAESFAPPQAPPDSTAADSSSDIPNIEIGLQSSAGPNSQATDEPEASPEGNLRAVPDSAVKS